MSDLEIWITIFALALATGLTRSSFWLVGHHITIPPRVQQMLRYAPACALAAIIAPDLLMDERNAMAISLLNPKMIAAAVATGYYLLRRSMIETIVLGMAVFTGLRIWLQ